MTSLQLLAASLDAITIIAVAVCVMLMRRA